MGLRRGELVALTARRIDLARRRLEVVEAITEVGRVVIGTTNPSAPLGAIPSFLADELTAQLAGKAPSNLVFTAPEGGVLQNTDFRPRFFDRAAEKAGLRGLTPHELRHTAVSLAIAAGANVKAVQQILGHSSAAMTLDVYAGLFADDLDTVADQLDGLQETRCRPDAGVNGASVRQIKPRCPSKHRPSRPLARAKRPWDRTQDP
jgi:integrase